MVLQIREVLHCPVCVNILVSLVSSTLEAIKGMFSVESMHELISPPRFPVPSIRCRIKVWSNNSSGISTVSTCVTSRYISFAKCFSPDDVFMVLLVYESTRFSIASRNLSLYDPLICPRRKAFTTVSSYSRLSGRLRRRASPFRSSSLPFLLDSALFFVFFFWQPRILDFKDRPVAFSQLSFFLVSFEKEPSSNASVICCENSMEYSYLRFETQLNWETRLCYGLKGNPTFTVEQHTRSSRAMPLSSMGQDPQQQCTLRVRDRMLPKKKTCCLDRVSLQQPHSRRISYYQIWRCAYRARYLE